MNKDLIAIFDYLEREKGIKRDVVVDAIKDALHAAARRSIEEVVNISIEINPRNGNIDVFSEKEIVEEVTDPAIEISLEEARELDPDCEIGQFLDILVTPKDFGRIAAQTARQVITQKLRGAERDVIYEEYRHRVNEILYGTVERFVKGSSIIVDLGKVKGFLPARHYPKTERYNIGDRIHALLLEVRDTEQGGAEIILSRADPQFVRILFEQEVPEIGDGTVVLEKIVREAGYRTKVTVRSTDSKVDPVGACVGMRGTRVKNVIRELNSEKVDIIPHSEDPVELLQNALDPIPLRKISIDEDEATVSIVVDDADFANVIGRKGMNARLNGQLLNVELEVQKMSEYRRAMVLHRIQLAESDDATLDEPLKLEGTSRLLVDNLVDAGFDTARKVLLASPEDLEAVPGISIDTADQIHESIRKERA